MRPAAAQTRRLWPEDVPGSSSAERLRARQEIRREARDCTPDGAEPCAGCANCDFWIAADNADALEAQRARERQAEDDRQFAFLALHGLITE